MNPYEGLATPVKSANPYEGLATPVAAQPAKRVPAPPTAADAKGQRIVDLGNLGPPTSPRARQAVAKLPVGAFYRDYQGNVRRNDNGPRFMTDPKAGNPVVPIGGASDAGRGMLRGFGEGVQGLLDADIVSDAAKIFGLKPTPDKTFSPLDVLQSASYGGRALGRQIAGDTSGAQRDVASARANTGQGRNLSQGGGYAPQTALGRGFQSAGQLLPSAALPASIPARIATVAAPLIAGEAAANIGGAMGANQQTQEGLRLGGQVVGGVASGLRPKVSMQQVPVMANASPQAVLKSYGVFVTPGAQIGGLAKNAEDLAQRFPILGPAIAGSRERSAQSLQRAVALNALAPVGKRVPKTIKPGYDMVRHVDDELGAVYDEAFDMVGQVAPDAQLATDLTDIAARKVDLPESMGATFTNIINDRLARLSKPGLEGRDVKEIGSKLSNLAAEYRAKGETTMADMLGDTRQALGGLIARNNPQAAALISKADEGWGIYKIMNKAAASADARGGVPTPGQLTTAVRQSAKRQGVNMAGKGEGRMQDLSSAAQQIIPDAFGNPGTANAVGFGAGLTGMFYDPASTTLAAGGLGAASVPYWMMGRKVLEELPANAGQTGQIGMRRVPQIQMGYQIPGFNSANAVPMRRP